MKKYLIFIIVLTNVLYSQLQISDTFDVVVSIRDIYGTITDETLMIKKSVNRIAQSCGLKKSIDPKYIFDVDINVLDIREVVPNEFSDVIGYYVNYKLEIYLKDKNDNLIYTFYFDDGKEFGNTKNEAKKYTIRSISKLIEENLSNELMMIIN